MTIKLQNFRDTYSITYGLEHKGRTHKVLIILRWWYDRFKTKQNYFKIYPTTGTFYWIKCKLYGLIK